MHSPCFAAGCFLSSTPSAASAARPILVCARDVHSCRSSSIGGHARRTYAVTPSSSSSWACGSVRWAAHRPALRARSAPTDVPIQIVNAAPAVKVQLPAVLKAIKVGDVYRVLEAAAFVGLSLVWAYVRRRLLTRGKYGAVSYCLSELQELRFTPQHTSNLCGLCWRPVEEQPYDGKLACGHNFHRKCLEDHGLEEPCAVCGPPAGASGGPGLAGEVYTRGILRLFRARFGELMPEGAEERFTAATSPLVYSLQGALLARELPGPLPARAAAAAGVAAALALSGALFYTLSGQLPGRFALWFAFLRLNLPPLLEQPGAPERPARAALGTLAAFLFCTVVAAVLSVVAQRVPPRYAFFFPLAIGAGWSLLFPSTRREKRKRQSRRLDGSDD